ncbi:fibronectin type III domain-containing protein [Xylanibacter muris]|uniref:Xanthan lyase n=1 Tax=Xylanibacter muris TaxID=2736290 RepID=A0ABX2APM1_9BACT|nr:fibronectin type III domain-containing protein [Xylanibacter muris]NPD92700.1 xanthan lyase [Xylanibacter muris]
MTGYKLDDRAKTITIMVNDVFAAQDFTPKEVEKIYKKIRGKLPKPYKKYKINVSANGMTIDELLPYSTYKDGKKPILWGDINYEGKPWVKNISSPIRITHGLQNRHIAVWASHGRYFDINKDVWKWQRPKLFGTCEDLFTPTIVVPYLIPMLENAGAIVFTPRERDWQRNEIVIDNDDYKPGTKYIEVSLGNEWKTANSKGFSNRFTYSLTDGQNPFTSGTARIVKTTGRKKKASIVSYQPKFPKDGKYAVYVSYQTVKGSVDDACYTVWHKGEKTEFHVNQKIGGGTWVYLGHFNFDKGSSEFNRVTISNVSSQKGYVTTDAVRFGGGMGNVERNGKKSNLPRCYEGARYYAQWAGMPYSIYSTRKGMDDYSDDINVRSLMTNYLAGSSIYVPSKKGLGVPLELALAVHSDAGYSKDGDAIIGSLAIYTTNFNDGRLNSGISRFASRDFAKALLTNIDKDLRLKYGNWNKRYLWDRNYSETRLPEVPSAIIETMSHQNFPDMAMGQDPDFKFSLARSLYKTIVRYVCDQHGLPSIISPLTPSGFKVEINNTDEALLSWKAVDDPHEPTSHPDGYIIYTATGHSDFDNGTYIHSSTNYKLKLAPDVLYSFKITAVNRGGESFPSDILCAQYSPKAKAGIMIVNGFHRQSSPSIRNNSYEQGFDIDDDMGITNGPTIGWVGTQTCFNRSRMGIEDESGLGWSNDNLTGIIIAGNNKDNVRTHAQAIHDAGTYNISSCQSEEAENGNIDLNKYKVIDFLSGLERDDGHSLVRYKTFSPSMQRQLSRYATNGGAIFVSGAYIGSDMTTGEDRSFLAATFKCTSSEYVRHAGDSVNGLGTTLSFFSSVNEDHYAATRSDVLTPIYPAFTAMRYNNGKDAAVAYKSTKFNAFAMGFPFECIKMENKRSDIMRGILRFLTE